MTVERMWPCPNYNGDSYCFERTLYCVCSTCNGEGSFPNGRVCPHCHGGEIVDGTCSMCNGTGEIKMSTGHVYEAWKRESRADDYHSGVDRPGITQSSLALWWERRIAFGTIVAVRARPEEDGAFAAIEVLNADGDVLKFKGLSYGYGGEGPHGLAAILADGGAFESEHDAMQWIYELPQGDAFARQFDARPERIKYEV